MSQPVEVHGLNINDDELIVRNDDRYILRDAELVDAAGVVKYTFSSTQLRPGQSTRGHKHDDSDEVYFVERGTGYLQLGSRTTPIKRGDVFYIPEGVFHRVENADGVHVLEFYSISPKKVSRPVFDSG